MATKKLPVKKKKIYWQKELEKATGKMNREMDALFRAFDKETAEHPMPLSDRNALWKKKYEPKYDRLDKKIDAAYLRLWKKYHNPNNTPKVGYIIVI